MRTIIGIYGKQLRGKTTIANYLMKQLPGFVINPLALAVKEEYCHMATISMATLEERKRRDPIIREGLQKLGHSARQKDAYHWINKCITYQGDFITDDIRYENEIEAFRQIADVFYLIRVEAPRDVIVDQERGNLSNEDHASETQLDTHDSEDFAIDNEYTLEILEGQCLWAANDIMRCMITHLLGRQRETFSEMIGVEDVQEG